MHDLDIFIISVWYYTFRKRQERNTWGKYDVDPYTVANALEVCLVNQFYSANKSTTMFSSFSILDSCCRGTKDHGTIYFFIKENPKPN